MADQQAHKSHRKGKEKKQSTQASNPKAFAVSRPGKLAKQAARSSDKREKKLHVPLVDRLPEEAPPFVVGIVGPPGVGKTTLVKSLVRRYTKQSVATPQGPITVVTSKRRRLTFLEVASDSLPAMIDAAKIVDLVLLVIDANFGFEMETMEFLNVMATHGMPGNVMGVLTHLDLFKKADSMRAAKKRLKSRLWTELYKGARLFSLSGVINGRYPDREILNLSRFLSVMKNPRPIIWRNSHPFCLADRMLDVTAPADIEENAKCDRDIALYGYLRGVNFPAEGARVHIPGVGDLSVSSVEALPDPCPTPFYKEAMEKKTGVKKKRLDEKQKIIWAPMSDVGGVLVDKDAVYVDVKTDTFKDGEELGLGEHLVVKLQGGRKLLGESSGEMRLFQGGDAVDNYDESRDTGRNERRKARVYEHDDDADEDVATDDEDDDFENYNSDDEVDGSRAPAGKLGRLFQKDEGGEEGDVAFADSDSDLGSISDVSHQELEEGDSSDEEAEEEEEDYDMSDEDDGALRWKDKIDGHVAALSVRKPFRVTDLSKMFYDESYSPSEVLARWSGQDVKKSSGKGGDDDFLERRASDEIPEFRTLDQFDYSLLEEKWSNEEVLEKARALFSGATGSGSEDEEGSDFDGFSGDEDDGFEDLEGGDEDEEEREDGSEDDGLTPQQKIAAERERNAKRKAELKLRFEEEDAEGAFNDKRAEREATGANAEREFGEDEWYEMKKAQMQTQLDINKAEFEALDDLSRVRVEGYRAGTYVKIVVSGVSSEFVDAFSPRYPLLIGGLTPTEERFGFVQARIKRHRWHRRILKTNDPLILSLGWRRFQTCPIFSTSDNRTRNRMLKYTPEHMHCFATFYAPLVAPGTAFVGMQGLSNSTPGFRIAASGTVLSVDESAEIVKKLKLTGVPYKIFKNTAFIKDMFSTPLEIAKFEGASLRTVSGVRGQVKRALTKPEGCFRATFEDKLLMSDIVFLRAWYPIKPRRYYNPVTELLNSKKAPEATSDGNELETSAAPWTGMRLTGAIRAAENIPVPQKNDSNYRPITRQTRHFNPLKVPKKIQEELPFKSQISKMKPQRRETYLQKRAVVASSEERKARALLGQMLTVRREKAEKAAEKKEKSRAEHRKKVANTEAARVERRKRDRDEFWAKEGKKRAGWEKKQRVG